MSTKSSVRYESDDESKMWFHLYTEAYDEEHIYLETAGFHFEASTLQDLLLEKGSPRIVIKFPMDWAKKLKLLELE